MTKMNYAGWKNISVPTICNLTECAIILTSVSKPVPWDFCH